MSALVSVVIPAYNCADYIGESLESVFSQTYRPLEVIVVDDGSVDDTDAAVRKSPDTIYVRQSNGGPARARNVGITRASGDYIAFLDADDLWTPGKLASQVSILDSDSEIGLVFGDMKNFFADTDDGPTMFEKYRLGETYFGDPRLVLNPLAKLVLMNFIPTGTVLARRRALTVGGLFDEAFRQAEDWDLWLRIALRFRIAYTPNLVMRRRLHDTNASKQTEAMSVAALQVLEKLRGNEREACDRAGARLGTELCAGYRNLGYFYLRQLSLEKARGAFMRSLTFGLDHRAILYLASTFLGASFVRTLIRARS